jgi:alpha-mannosidase
MNIFDRREFMQAAAVGVFAVAANASAAEPAMMAESTATQPAAPWAPRAQQFRLHLIPNAHIDAAWLWPWEEGASEVMSTFRSMLEEMRRTPAFTFTASAAQYYQWVAETDPAMLKEIRQRVDEGRWGIVGGWWIEPDVNMPNGEALIRQGLYAQQIFQRLFGRTVRVGYNPDSFGHPATLPQILNLQRMQAYVFWRPHPDEKQLPADLFWWEGPDGTRVLAFRILDSYVDWGSVEPRIRQFVAQLHEPTTDLMDFIGAGDHGGGATRENVASVEAVQKQPGAPTLIFSTPERYFDEIRSKEKLDLPVVRDDLQHTFVGCYTAMSEIKKNNRQAELLLMAGERICALAATVADYEYPREAFSSAWKKVLLMQFHDSLSGTARPEHYVTSRNAYGYAMETATYSLYRAAAKIAWQVPAEDSESAYLVVFNPHAWPATLDVEYDLDWTPSEPSVLRNSRGDCIEHQWTQASVVDAWTYVPKTGERNKLVFKAPLPSFGYEQFRLQHAPSGVAGNSRVSATAAVMENEHFRLVFLEDGSVDLFDKEVGRHVFQTEKGGQRGLVMEDQNDTWGNGVQAYNKEIGSFDRPSFRVLENGPVRAKVRVRTFYGGSTLETDWLLYAGTRTVETRVTLDWHERHKLLKFSYPVDVDAPQATYEIAYGHIVRKTEGLEDPGQRWVDLSGTRSSEKYGLAVVNDAKYGYSVERSDLRVSIVRGVVYAWEEPSVGKLKPDGEYHWQDQGTQTFRTWLAPHRGSWQNAGLVRLTDEFTGPVPVVYQGIHPGTRPQSASFLSVDVPNVVVTVVKKAEEGEDLILRCYETAGRPTTATLELALAKRRWTGSFRPSEIKTLRVMLASGQIREVDALE